MSVGGGCAPWTLEFLHFSQASYKLYSYPHALHFHGVTGLFSLQLLHLDPVLNA